MKPPVIQTRHFYIASLIARCAAFFFLVAYTICDPQGFSADLEAEIFHITPLTLVWLLLILSMLFRFFPSQTESIGCQKEFVRRMSPSGHAPSRQEIYRADRGALWVFIVWLALNGCFFLGHRLSWLSDRFMVCLAGFYGVCDIICILFFCPFQAWIMHNRCCTTCRIFNWDYLMICTPLFSLPFKPLVCSACVLSVLLFLRWEFTYYRRSERFFESSNTALQCSRCQEHLCKYKRALTQAAKEQHHTAASD